MKNRPPDGHIARAVRDHDIFARNRFADANFRKISAISLGQRREVGRGNFERRGGRALPFRIRSVTRRAVGAEQFGAVKRAN